MVDPCYYCLCNSCINNAESITIIPNELPDNWEPCFFCDDCRIYDGDTRKKNMEKAECTRYQIDDYHAKENRKKIKLVKGGVLMEKNKMWFLFQFLHEVEESISREAEKQVMIEKAINLRLMCDYVVSCSYGDVVLIICMLHDYVKTLDEVRQNDIQYQAYYRGKFLKMANRLAEQIGYDYEAALERCRKKQQRKSDSDVGEEALALAARYGSGKKKGTQEGGKR